MKPARRSVPHAAPDARRRAALVSVLLSSACWTWPVAAQGTRESLPAELGIDQLLQFSVDASRPHEARPIGVPASFDWARAPRPGALNEPGSFKAATGWAQIFRSGESQDSQAVVHVRQLQVLICHGPQRRWELVQRGDIEGAQFRADFAQNVTRRAPLFKQAAGVATIRFDPGAAFHYWSAHGRFDVPPAPLCGWLVLMQARQEGPATEEPTFLIGLGADYWLDRRAPWDNFRTNRDVAIGRLNLARASWAWFGMTTASEADLRNLREKGYEVRPGVPAVAR